MGPAGAGEPLLSTTASAGGVVISQVYGGGGNSGATYKNDFIELFNAGSTSVSLDGWTVQYASAAGTTWARTNLSGEIAPGSYYLVQQAAGSGGTTDLPTPEATGNISMAAGAGKVAVVSSTTALTGTCPTGGNIVDFVGFGTTANCFEGGGPTPAPSNTNAVLRKDAGCTDTNENAADFTAAAPTPRNSGSPKKTCDAPPPPPPTSANVVISELMTNPVAAESESWGEWFEVYNADTVEVNLQGWRIASGGQVVHTIAAAVVIPAGGYAVLGRGHDITRNGGVTLNYNYFTSSTTIWLDDNDWLALRDPAGATADSVAWSGASYGATRAVREVMVDNTDGNGANWGYSTTAFGAGDLGTPGQANGELNSTPPPPPPPGVVAKISLGITPPQVPAGYTRPVFPTARDAYNDIISPPPAYVWTSSDPMVATVDNLGYITGRSVGTVTITATAPNGVFGRASFSVTPGEAPTTAVYRNHLEFGIPKDGSPGDDYLMEKRQFALSYSQTRGGPNWVSWNINATQFGPEDRCNCFTADQTLPAGFYKVVDFDYRGGGYDRGHMVQSFTRTTTELENAATFLLTNILPQAANNNQGPWGAFENYTNNVVRQQGKEAYVIAGGEYSANPQTLKGEGKVQIPEFTWKVVVFVDAGKGLADVRSVSDLEVIAVRMANDTAGARTIRNTPWETFRTTVDAIEAATGYNLLDKLPDTIERFVESGRPLPAAIDIMPGNADNSVSLNNTGLLPVAILTTATFDAAQIDVATVVLGDANATETAVAKRRNGSYFASLEDVNGDGKADLVVHFSIPALQASGDLNGSTSQLILQSRLKNQVPIQGADKVRIVS
jgi:DNA/RNA endonuclease G (NUC1)